MRVAFCNRPDWDNPLGGDGIQMLKTKSYLEKQYGLNIDIITNPDNLSSEYDIVHIFNFATCKITDGFFVKAQELNIPIASSSIFWDYDFYTVEPFFNIFGYPKFITRRIVAFYIRIAKIVARFSKKLYFLTPECKKYYKKFISHSDVILPNSIEEGELLLRYAGMKKCADKISVAYNGVELEEITDNIVGKVDFLQKYSIPDDYILEIGRIEYCKGQLNLVSSLFDHPEIPIVFVGRPTGWKLKYYSKVKTLAEKRGNVFFINAVPHEEVKFFYKYAAVHVLPSLRESPGLVSLEAQSLGCPIVVSSKEFLPLGTYFSGIPYVIDPLNKDSMRNTILKAYKERKLLKFDNSKFTWDNVAKQTFKAYQYVLSTK